MTRSILGSAISSVCLLAACGGSPGPSELDVANACNLMKNGPSMAANAGASIEIAGTYRGFVNAAEVRFDVEIDKSGDAGAHAGYLLFTPGTFTVFMADDINTLFETHNSIITPSSSRDFASCPEIKVSHTFTAGPLDGRSYGASVLLNETLQASTKLVVK